MLSRRVESPDVPLVQALGNAYTVHADWLDVDQNECEVQRGVRLLGHQLVLAERSDKKEQATFFLSANRKTKVGAPCA